MGIDYEALRNAVTGGDAGIRSRTVLEPLGGPGDKIFPPTFGVDSSAETKYAVETRRVDGADVEAVLIDSVASQANRFELALLDAVRGGELELPLVSVDFREADEISDLDRISALEAPHRVFDAILRDSLLHDRVFRLSGPGIAITEATPRNAAALYHYSPTTLLFGGWDSTGPKGGRGSKFERAITSEVVAVGINRGVKTASRIDPLGIESKAATIYEAADDLGWTVNERDAVRDDKGRPTPKTGRGDKSGRPSLINHSNVTPSIDSQAGGVTADQIMATTVLSFVALRRLRFPLDQRGQPLVDRADAEAAARTTLAALGLAATVLAFDGGFDLRSRCVLAPTSALTFELIRRSGGDPTSFTLSRHEAIDLVGEAASVAGTAGLPWHDEEILLQPADRLVDLVERSRRLTEHSVEADEDD